PLNPGQSLPVSCSRDLNKFDGEGGPLEKDRLYLVQTFVSSGDYVSDALGNADGTPGNYWILYGDKLSGLELVREDLNYGIAPDPAGSEVVLTAPGPITAAEVFTISGAKVLTCQFTGGNLSERLDISSLPVGHYIVLIRHATGCGASRLLKR
ncbi:MAG: T9SS type A sorting domain-containing protein, partial [Duncaniella sp.]|nr:T9SS type A sorting domain-containing protein [Duncaniella sp.]